MYTLVVCALHCCTTLLSFSSTWEYLDQQARKKGLAFCSDMGKASMYEDSPNGKLKYVGPNPYKCLTKFRKMKLTEENYNSQAVPGYETTCGKENN